MKKSMALLAVLLASSTALAQTAGDATGLPITLGGIVLLIIIIFTLWRFAFSGSE